MINLETQNHEKYLLIGGQQIYPIGETDHYIIPYDTIIAGDLSSAPAGTSIDIDYQGAGRTPSEMILIRKIGVLHLNKVCVTADHYRCPCCWENALSFEKYTNIVAKIFKDHESSNDGRNKGFTIIAMEINDEAEPSLIFSLDISNGSFKKIEKQVRDAAIQLLKPLMDFRDSLDAQILQQFGV
jgi:hypothetical protein